MTFAKCSSRFNGKTKMPFLHARDVRTVEYVDRSIAIGVVSMPARSADEGRLVLAAPTVHRPAGRAGLRSVRRVDLHETAGLVSQHGFDLVPSDVQDRAVEPALLGDVAAGSFDGPRRAFGHVLRAQSLNDNRAILPRDGRGGPVRPILADTSLPGTEAGNAGLGDGLALASPLATGDDTASRVDLLGKQADAGGQFVAGAIGQHQRHSNAPVDADCTNGMDNVTVDLAPDADLPAEIRMGDGRLHDAAFDRAEASELDPSDLGHLHSALVSIEAPHLDLPAGEGKAVVDALAVRGGECSTSREEILERGIERAHGHLLGCLADGADKVELGAQRGQLASLRHIVEVVASPILVSFPPVAALLQADVVDQATHTRMLTEQSGLRLCRFQPKSDATIYHIKLNGTQRAKSQVPLSLPRLKAGVSRGEFR